LKLTASGLTVVLASAACGGGKPAPAPSPLPPAPAAAPALPSRPVLHVVRVRDTELYFVDRGTGIPVVLVHGSFGTLDSWQPQVDSFATRFRVIAYSRRYHPPGPGRPDGQAYALALHADDLIAFIEALGLQRVHLVGSSYGAYIALLVTLRRPDLVRSLVLTEPPMIPWLGRTPEGDSLRRAFEASAVEPARRAFARGDSAEALRRFVDGMTGRPGGFDALPPAARTALLRLAFELRLELTTDPAAYMPALACREVGGVRNSVLLVTGERSPRLFRIITDELGRCLPAAETMSVPRAGHFAHADNPLFYNAVVLRFLIRN
jgi:pimeloyl-ACP methyl ester carboxylesterase